MELVNPLTAYPIGMAVENINGVPMRGIAEKQGWAFSRAGYLAAKEDPTLDADAIGRAVRRQLRPLSKPTLEKARAEYARREVIKFPRYFIIEPTAFCNRACPFCTILVTNRKGSMKWADFEKLMQECSEHDVYGLSLYQLGEPFLWRESFLVTDALGGRARNYRWDISQMVNHSKTVGGFRAVNLSTNGDVDNLDCILGSQLDDLIISIDGTTEEVYSVNRPSTKRNDVGAFERTLQRVHTFLDHKAARGEAKPFVRLQIINKENTASQVLEFVRYWIDVPGVDDVFVKNLDSMRPWFGDKVVSDAEDQLKAQRTAGQVCQHIYAVGSMTADGSLNACCHDALTELTTAGANIRNMTFADWWNGEYMNGLRESHKSGAYNHVCRECREKDTWLGA